MIVLFLSLVGLAIWLTRVSGHANALSLEMAALGARLRDLERQVAERPPIGVPSAPPDRQVASVAPPPIFAPPPAPASLPKTVPVASIPAATTSADVLTAPGADEGDSWEVTVGGNWLNKIGVFVFVIGLALLVGYSMTHVGPAGRVAIGFAVSLTMLGAGVVLERRAEYRNYAYGLIAGGWGGVYFTTYAMHAVGAARIVDSDLVAIVALAVVAGSMIAQSLRYRSQVVSALAFIVAFATLALTPLSGFALAASLPLAVSVVVVARQRDWPGVSVLAVLGTYGLFILRGTVFAGGDVDARTLTPYLALGAYWLLFEAADLTALARSGVMPKVPLLLMNGAGLVGAGLLRLPVDTPTPLTMFLSIVGAAYLASAGVRAKIEKRAGVGRGHQGREAELLAAAYGTHQGAVLIAAAVIAWAIATRFTGSREAFGLVVEAELLFLSGLALKDRVVRGCGSAVAMLATLHGIELTSMRDAPLIEWASRFHTFAPVLIVIAVVWYANREVLRARAIRPLIHEWVYTVAGTWLLVLVASRELTQWHAGLVVLALAVALLEAGLRRGREYCIQAYVAGAGAATSLLIVFAARRLFVEYPGDRDAWTVLPAAAVLAYVAAWRAAPKHGGADGHWLERAIAAAASEYAGLAFIVVLEWRVLDPAYVALAWAATAGVILAAGLRAKLRGLRWQAYPLLLVAFVRVTLPILDGAPSTPVEIGSAVAVMVLLYAAGLAVRRGIARGAGAGAEIEDLVRIAMLLASTVALGLLLYREVRGTLVTLAWGLEGAALLLVGFPARERVMRLSGLAVLLVCIVRLFSYDLAQLDGLARILSFVALGLVLLGVSWTYTRYRAQIRKFL